MDYQKAKAKYKPMNEVDKENTLTWYDSPELYQ